MTRSKLLSLVTMILFAGITFAADSRTWSDASGKFKLQAKFIAVKEGKVTLEKPDGAQFEIELAKLCDADQKYVADQQKKAEENPFKAKDSEAASPFTPAATGDVNRTIDWSGARFVDPNPAESTWKLSIQGPEKATAVRPVSLPATGNFFEKVKGAAINAAGTHAVIGYSVQQPGSKDATSRLLFCDLANGKITGTGTVSGTMVPIALSDEGNRVLLRREEWGHSNQDQVELATMENKQIKILAKFTPYDDLKNADRNVTWAAFAGPNRLLTVSGSGKLASLDMQSFKPEYHLTIQNGCRPGLSPDRSVLAYATGQEVGVLDVATGKVLFTQPMANAHWPALAFSPSGKRLACAAFNKVHIWDAATGAAQTEMTTHNVHMNGELTWPNEEQVLVGHTTLLDPGKQVNMWTYHGGEAFVSAGGNCWAVLSEGNRAAGAMMPVKLPHAAAKAALDKALADPEFFILKKGTTVTLDVSGLADADQQDKVRDLLTKKLEANGCKVGSGGITLVASTEVGKTRDVTYHTFGRAFGDKTYSVTEHFTRLKFMWQDKVAWESSSLNIPHFVHLKEGETMESYLREHEKPNYKFYESVELPKLLTKPTGQAALGTSRLTAAGLR